MGLEILRAIYGPSDAETTRPFAARFVHDTLNKLITKPCHDNHPAECSCHNSERLVLDTTYNGIFGDPCPDEPKVLRITYRINNGKVQSRIWAENSIVVLDTPSALHRQKQTASEPALLVKRDTAITDLDYDVMGVILNFLPFAPDRFRLLVTCKLLKQLVEKRHFGDRFEMGDPHVGENYLNASIEFVERALRKSATNLITLDLSFYHKLTDTVLREPLSKMTNLRVLYLNGCSLLTDESVLTIACNDIQLEKLELKRLRNITDKSMVPVCSVCTSLTHLNLSDCRQLTNATVSAVAKLPLLRVLFLKDVHLADDASVKRLMENNDNQFEVLTLWALHRLTPAMSLSFSAIIRTRLLVLNLWGCHNLDDVAIENVCKVSPNLRNLSVRFCHLLTDRSLIAISSLSDLEHLDAYYLRRITDVGLQYVANNTKLRSLNLSQCPKLTVNGLLFACRALFQLSELSLMGNRWVTDQVLHQLVLCYSSSTAENASDTTGKMSEFKKLDLIDIRQCKNVNNALDIVLCMSPDFVQVVPGCFSK